ncbi:MAG: AAA family ATPase, partial [bacterium]|nr:AAA family ATPase [bacterium]
MTPKPPIGYSDFRELRENGRLYVDKSGLISDIVQDPAQVILFPRPRRFGKTLNLSLVRYFFERRQQDLSPLFEDLEVWGDGDARQHFQRYPTIFVTFKDVAARDFHGTLEGVREVVRQTYESHRYLLDAGSLTSEQADRYRLHLRAEASEVVLCGALRDLAELLVSHHGERVLVLIDEYDTPIQQGHDQVVTLFRNLFSALLKDNANVYRGILTGIFRIARESLFSGLNNLAVRSLLDSAYSKSFGFTEDEVAWVIKGTTQTVLDDELRAWYDGYCFGGEVIYNPWSVLCYAETGKLQAHWASTSSNELIRKLILGRGLTLASQIEILLRGGTIDKSIDENVVLRDLDHKTDGLWRFLTFS